MTRTRALAPARQVLTEAARANETVGHENRGFLSESHGFLPCRQLLLRLPPSFAPWDDTAAGLPELFRTLTLRQALDGMPVLDAGPEELPDPFLLRASAIVGIFAHAYFYVDPDPPEEIPESVRLPWAEISRRLGQPAPHLSFTDLNLYNWRLVDQQRADPMRVENLELLVPIVGNEDERRFQMTPVEMVAHFTPVVGAVVRAQEAVLADDTSALQRELVLIADTLEQLTFVSFMKVDPNPYGRLYVNPVVWGKTVAPLATPFQPDPPPGPSGTAIPAFQLLDVFFGRHGHGTSIGHETARVRRWFPEHWQAFLAAVEAVSVPDHVARSGDSTLQGMFLDALEAYAGEAGLLGRHRLKTFGFLDLSFKAGRSKTLGGFGGGFEDRLWDRMDGELDLARLERYPSPPQGCHHARVKHVEPVAEDQGAWVGRVVLDVAGTGIRYRPGSRCAVLPENGDELVERTLRALRARGDEPVELNARWREAVASRPGYEHARVLTLRTLLRFGHIRPVDRPVAKALHRITHNETLRRVVEARAEDQWELWELMDLLAGAGFDPKRLWKAHPGERDGICWVVPPESFRMYSMSSAMADPEAAEAEELHLTVGRLRYETKATEVSRPGVRFGTASTFLSRLSPAGGDRPPALSVKVVRPAHFSLPRDRRRPVVMLAGGTGLSPFRGMLLERASQEGAGENWLFLGTRTHLYYREELSRLVGEGKLHLRVAFSGEDLQARSVRGPEGWRLVVEPGRRHRIGEEILAEDDAGQLWPLLRSEAEGGMEASFYVCGRTGFATAVMAAVTEVLARHGEGSEHERQEQARHALRRLVGEGRYMQEVFTTYPGPQFEQRRTFDASEVVAHNNDQDGYWLIVDGRVYDLTEFAHIHPGGPKIIRSYAGMDATAAYRRARHDTSPEVNAMLAAWEIGAVRRLDLAGSWGVAVSPTGLRVLPLKDIYRAWIGLLYATVETENALANDYGIRCEPVTHDEAPGAVAMSPYKARLLLDTHRRFFRDHLATLTGARLERLWAVTAGLGSDHQPVGWMGHAVRALWQGAAGRAAAELDEQVVDRLRRAIPIDGPADGQALRWCVERGAEIEREDRRLLAELKAALAAGVRVLEGWEPAIPDEAAHALLAAARALPSVLGSYLARLAALGGPVEPPTSSEGDDHP